MIKPISILSLLLFPLLGIWVSTVSAEEQESVEQIHNYHGISEQLLTAGQVHPRHIKAIDEQGVELVINLAPASEKRNQQEGFLVTSAGINYVQIPIKWDNPTDEDLQLFFAVMSARKNRKTLVHCFANYRASAFTYLYRVLQEGVDETEARKALFEVWDNDAFNEAPQWRTFINRHLGDVIGGPA